VHCFLSATEIRSLIRGVALGEEGLLIRGVAFCEEGLVRGGWTIVHVFQKKNFFFKSFPEKQFPNLTFDSLKIINSKNECIDGYMDHAYPTNNGCKSKYRYLLENVAPCILVR
jgi:hypothetical protein